MRNAFACLIAVFAAIYSTVLQAAPACADGKLRIIYIFDSAALAYLTANSLTAANVASTINTAAVDAFAASSVDEVPQSLGYATLSGSTGHNNVTDAVTRLAHNPPMWYGIRGLGADMVVVVTAFTSGASAASFRCGNFNRAIAVINIQSIVNGNQANAVREIGRVRCMDPTHKWAVDPAGTDTHNCQTYAFLESNPSDAAMKVVTNTTCWRINTNDLCEANGHNSIAFWYGTCPGGAPATYSGGALNPAGDLWSENTICGGVPTARSSWKGSKQYTCPQTPLQTLAFSNPNLNWPSTTKPMGDSTHNSVALMNAQSAARCMRDSNVFGRLWDAFSTRAWP